MTETQIKAKELFDKYMEFDFNTIVLGVQKEYAKQCALIAVEEVIKQLHKSDKGYTLVDDIIYWNEVKAEIEKL